MMVTPGNDIQLRLSACSSVGELRRTLDSLCADFGGILNVTVLCHHGSPQKKLCVVDLIPDNSDAQRCAQRLGGRVFGYSSVIIDLIPHPAFECPRGTLPALARDCSCTART